MRPSGGPEVAEIFRQHGPAYRESHRLPRNQLRVMRAIEVCRTAVLGGLSRPFVDPFVKIWAPVANPYRYKRANKAPYPPSCR
jgi:hypothetical protein